MASVWVLPRVTCCSLASEGACGYAARLRLCQATTATEISFPPKLTQKDFWLAQFISQAHCSTYSESLFQDTAECIHLVLKTLRARDDFQLQVTSFPAPLVLSWQGQCCEAYQKYSCMSNIIRVSYLCQYLSVLFVSNTRDSNANESMSVHFIFVNQLYGWIAHTNIKCCQRQSGRGCSFYCLTVETDVPGVWIWWQSIATGSLTLGWAHRGPRTENLAPKPSRLNPLALQLLCFCTHASFSNLQQGCYQPVGRQNLAQNSTSNFPLSCHTHINQQVWFEGKTLWRVFIHFISAMVCLHQQCS